MKAVLLEAVAVALIGGAVALLANALSPKGLALSRNYFPATSTPAAPVTNTPSGNTTSNSPAMMRLAARGIQLVDSNFVAQAFGDPKRTQHLIMFIDAREETYYQQGHVPGAYQLDYYRPEPHLPVVLPAASAAETVIIYCNGGDCEDSEFAAGLLSDAGVPPEKLRVYSGGFSEWAANKMPVETGPKDSGMLHKP